MTTGTANRHRRLLAGLIAAAVPGAAIAVLAGPPATGANDPCAASEVARTIGSVSKSMGDSMDSQPVTNPSMRCKLPITIPQAMGLMQQAQGAAGGLPGGLPALPGGGAPGTAPSGGAPGAMLPGVTVGGAPRPNSVG